MKLDNYLMNLPKVIDPVGQVRSKPDDATEPQNAGGTGKATNGKNKQDSLVAASI